MAKSRDAFRTISEVSDALDTPTHVLRFWESKFSQIKPVKRAGGRRYYRPEDIDLLAGIKTLLHDHGMTIKGAQKLLREQGVKHVSGLGDDAHAETPKVMPIVAAPAPAPEIAVDETPKMPAPAASKSPERTSILTEVAAPNQMMIKANAAQIATLLTKLEKLCDQMRAA